MCYCINRESYNLGRGRIQREVKGIKGRNLEMEEEVYENGDRRDVN